MTTLKRTEHSPKGQQQDPQKHKGSGGAPLSKPSPSTSIEVMLKIEGKYNYRNREYCIVKFSPDSREPFDWLVPVIPGLTSDISYIRCKYENDKLRIVETWLLRKRYNLGSKHEFTVVESLKQSKNAYSYLLKDKYGCQFEVTSQNSIPLQAIVTCAVKEYRKKSLPPHYLALKVVKYRETLMSYLEKESSPSKKDNDESRINYPNAKTPGEWIHEVAGYDKHIYGNAGVCSCCGKAFGPRQGWRVELKNVFFCKSCKSKIYEPTGKGWMNIVYTPMGGKKR